jgi:hypothetical protein
MEIMNILKKRVKLEKSKKTGDYMTSGFVMRVQSGQGYVNNLYGMTQNKLSNR